MTTCKYCKSKNVKHLTVYKFYDVYTCIDCELLTSRQIDDCCRDPFEIFVVKYDKFQQPVAIYKQCKHCGGSFTMKKAFNFKEYTNKTQGYFSRERLEEWKASRHQESKEIYEINNHIQYTKTNDFLHKTHLQTEYWRTLRRQTLERDKYVCQSCKQAVATVVHHLTYKNLGNEFLDELISYCKACHELVHGKTTSH